MSSRVIDLGYIILDLNGRGPKEVRQSGRYDIRERIILYLNA